MMREWLCYRNDDWMIMLQRQWQNDNVTETMIKWVCYRDNDRMIMLQRQWQNDYVTETMIE
jgi:hypothetical protein